MSLLFRNSGYVAMLTSIEKTAAGSGFYWLDQPDSKRVSEGDRVELEVQHNQSSGVTLQWQQADDHGFTQNLIDLSAVTGEISGQATAKLVIEEAKVERFPRPTIKGTQVVVHPKFYRCKATHSSTDYFSQVASVMINWENPKMNDPRPIKESLD